MRGLGLYSPLVNALKKIGEIFPNLPKIYTKKLSNFS
jgi:hypothetical protein